MTEPSVHQDQDIEASTFNSEDQSQIENDAYAGTDITEHVKCMEDHFASNSQVTFSVKLLMGHLAVSVGCEFESHVGCRDYLSK